MNEVNKIVFMDKIGNMLDQKKILWVGWENHRRNVSISAAIGADLYEFNEPGGRIARYTRSMWKTFRLFRKQKPDVIICQNPSLVLTIFCMLYKFFYGAYLAVDMHNAGLGEDTNSKLLKKISVFIQKNIDLNIVTNKPLHDMVVANGGESFILPDKIPLIDVPSESYRFSHEINLLFICTYARDEPYLEVFEACKLLKDSDVNIGVYVTGKVPDSLNKKTLSDNVYLLGFVSWEIYDQLLFSCDGIIDLTLMDDCLVCGGYEALAFNKPILLSDSKSSMEYFGHGACYTDNSTNDIVQKVIYMCEKLKHLERKQEQHKIFLEKEWDTMKSNLLAKLGRTT